MVKGKVYKILLTEVKKNFFNLVTDQVQPNEPEITNHKPVTDNSLILNFIGTFFIENVQKEKKLLDLIFP